LDRLHEALGIVSMLDAQVQSETRIRKI
jgi:hypothetical protein